MWPGPYGDWGSRKYLLASLDQSLKRMGVEYVDIFYSHRPDPETPVEETMGALDQAVRSGKALYAGISNYSASQAAAADQNTARTGHALPDPSAQVFDVCAHAGERPAGRAGQRGRGRHRLLSAGAGPADRPLSARAFPADSRATKAVFLKSSDINEHRLKQIRALNELAAQRGQSLAQMALAWVLRDSRMTSALIGASRVEQIEQNVAALANLSFTAEELACIDAILEQAG